MKINNSESSVNTTNDELLTRQDACKYLHVSQATLDSHLSIPKVRIGRRVLYQIGRASCRERV